MTWSVADFAQEPNLLNGFSVVWDAGAVIIPGLPAGAGKLLKAGKYTPEIAHSAQKIISNGNKIFSKILEYVPTKKLRTAIENVWVKFKAKFGFKGSGGVPKGAGNANYVYLSKNAEGLVQYVGITNNIARRQAEHLASKGIQIEKLLGGLSRDDARAVEQALIEMHGLGKNGGTLLNMINSISVKNPKYGEQLERGYELLKSIGYK